MKRPAAATLNDHILLRPESHGLQKKRTVASHFETVNSLVETYVTDELIDETDDDIMRFPQSPNKLSTEYAEAL